MFFKQFCASGYRSSIATSLLEQKGFVRVTNVVGGMGAWNAGRLQTVVSSWTSRSTEFLGLERLSQSLVMAFRDGRQLVLPGRLIMTS